jgi:Raf kinase inhibitor-like YbhB/YbcL family protein
MQPLRAWRLAAAALALAGCSSDNTNTTFTLASQDIPSGGTIAAAQVLNNAGLGCSGGNTSPELHWDNPPPGTQSFAVTMFDQDAPTGSGFWHWTVFDIPASARSLPKGAGGGSGGSGTSGLPSGAVQGYTDFGATGYGGPCPPAGDTPHRYTFTVYALKVPTLAGVDAGSTGAFVTFNAKGNSLGSASFTATYSQPGTNVPHPDIPTAAGFTLTSAEVQNNGTIAAEQVFTGCAASGTAGNTSPSLTWTAGPAGTQSYLVTVFDPDAPTGSGFWHWVAFNIPAATTSLPKGAGSGTGLPAGAVQAKNDFGQNAYGGPCPPVGDPAHHYHFTVYAMPEADLGAEGLGPAATGGFVGFVTRASPTGRALAKAELVATYGR